MKNYQNEGYFCNVYLGSLMFNKVSIIKKKPEVNMTKANNFNEVESKIIRSEYTQYLESELEKKNQKILELEARVRANSSNIEEVLNSAFLKSVWL